MLTTSKKSQDKKYWGLAEDFRDKHMEKRIKRSVDAKVRAASSVVPSQPIIRVSVTPMPICVNWVMIKGKLSLIVFWISSSIFS